MDFDDLLMITVELFGAFPDVLDHYQRRFQYVLVDEYQDTNRAQYTLVKQLAGQHRNLCVVGDSDQSIYRFRGADIRNILDFESDYPDARVVVLGQNYRSTEVILEAANSVIANNDERKPKHLWTDRGRGELLSRYEAEDEHDEAAFVAEQIDALEAEGRQPPTSPSSIGPMLKPGGRRGLRPVRHPVYGGRWGQVLRSQGNQRRGRLPAGTGQSRRRSVTQTGHQ